MLNNKTAKDYLYIMLVTLLLTFSIWIPHYLAVKTFFNLDFNEGFNTIYRNFDGMEYVIIAKSFYNPDIIATLPQSLSANYYAAHFPGYSILILIFAPLLGFLKSMLFVSFLFTILSALAFYQFLKKFNLTAHPLFLTFIFLLLPARWLIVHSVGSSEPVFIFFILLSLYFFTKFEQTKNWSDIHLASFFGLFAQITRPPGILLFIALSIYIFYKILKDKQNNFFTKIYRALIQYHPLLLIPTGLLAIFYWYSLVYNDFFAYFNSGDNIHLTFPPFQVFNINQYWVGDIWLEDIIYVFIIGFSGGIFLLKQKLTPLAFFVLTYLTASILIAHRDISRYLLPIFPFILIAFEKFLTSKEFKIVLIILSLAIYLYAQNFILQNTDPIPNPQILD